MRVKGAIKNKYYIGERIYFECVPGYYHFTIHVMSGVCKPDNTWTTPMVEACLKKECPSPVVKHGEAYSPNKTFEYESEAHFFCNEGYYLVENKVILCILVGNDVKWNDTVPKCEKVYCKSPGQIKNGKHTNSHRDILEYNELITYSCNHSKGPEEYSLVGESKLICSGNGRWSSAPPQCKG
nr:membrane cofactor protein-like [Manis javanica]